MSVHKSAAPRHYASKISDSHILPSEVLIFRQRTFVVSAVCYPIFTSSLFFCVKAFCVLEKSVYSSPTCPLAHSIHVPFCGFEMKQNVFQLPRLYALSCTFLCLIWNLALASEGISHISWIWKVHYCVHKNPWLVPILSNFSPVHALPNDFCKIDVKHLFVLGFPYQNILPSCLPLYISHITPISFLIRSPR